MRLTKRNLEIAVFIAVMAAAIFLRLWQIRDYVVFLGDEGRDMIVMRNMILEKRPVFLGPTASVGGFYLGPIYYWMAAPFLALAGFDPVGPSIMVALFSVATVLLLFKFLKEISGFWPAILASSLYSFSPLILRYSRSSWNPNPLPFFALLMMYCIYQGIIRVNKTNQQITTKAKLRNLAFFLVAGLSFGIAIQLHYLSIMLIPLSVLIIVLNTNPRKWPLIGAVLSVGSVITFSPFLIFEIRHSFPNFKTIYEFVTRKTTHGFKITNIFWVISNFGNIFLEEISKLNGTSLTRNVFWSLTVGNLFIIAKSWRHSSKRLAYTLGFIWFIGGLSFLRFYSGQIFDYYYGFMFPAPFFVFGLIAGELWQKNTFKLIFISATILIAALFLDRGFWKSPPNRLINQTAAVADFVAQKSENKQYNFALISEHNSDHAYRYFLEIKKAKPLDLETLVTDQLLVVCESKKCAPLGYPSWEIAGFGRAEIQKEWELPDIGIKVFRLTHWPGVPNPTGKPAQKGQ